MCFLTCSTENQIINNIPSVAEMAQIESNWAAAYESRAAARVQQNSGKGHEGRKKWWGIRGGGSGAN